MEAFNGPHDDVLEHDVILAVLADHDEGAKLGRLQLTERRQIVHKLVEPRRAVPTEQDLLRAVLRCSGTAAAPILARAV